MGEEKARSPEGVPELQAAEVGYARLGRSAKEEGGGQVTPEGFGLLKALIQQQDPTRVQCPRCHGDGNENFDDDPCRLCNGACWIDAGDAEYYLEEQAAMYQSGPDL